MVCSTQTTEKAEPPECAGAAAPGDCISDESERIPPLTRRRCRVPEASRAAELVNGGTGEGRSFWHTQGRAPKAGRSTDVDEAAGHNALRQVPESLWCYLDGGSDRRGGRASGAFYKRETTRSLGGRGDS